MSDVPRFSSGQIGRSLPRLESRAKVTGTAEYIHNLRLPGMLYGKICRSTVPHGRIRCIETRAAAAIGGVHRVVTAADIRTVIAEPYYGPAFHDQPILAEGKVRHVGEPVAAVLAADPHIAEQAAQAIEIDYEPMPAVFDEVEAVSSAVFVHDQLKPAGNFADLKHLVGRRDTNIALDFHLRRGDPAKAFAQRRAGVRAHLPHPADNAHPVRTACRTCGCAGRVGDNLQLDAEPILCPH
jgi:CO/xanthine dehydrogenase Mo-binding subunit